MLQISSLRRVWQTLLALAAATFVTKLVLAGGATPPNWWQWLDLGLTVGTFAASVNVWFGERREQKLREQPIIIVIVCDALAPCELPIRPLRQHLNRAELLGILGMYFGRDRFDPLELLPTIEPGVDGLSPLNRVVKGLESRLTIQLTKAAFDRIRAGIPQLAGPAPELPTPK